MFSFTFLGTGDSAQVPVYNCSCAACTRARAQVSFRRRPSSAMLTIDDKKWLIDSGRTDLRELFPPPSLAGILQTHYHADHAQGLLTLRWGLGITIPVWGPEDPVGFADLYKHPGILDFSATWQPFETRQVASLRITAVPLNHSRPCFGYVIQSPDKTLAYLTDTVGLPTATQQFLSQLVLDDCIVDCSFAPRAQPHRNHNDVNTALAMYASLSIRRLFFTHIGHELDNWLMQHGHTLPDYVHIAQDNMVLTRCATSPAVQGGEG